MLTFLVIAITFIPVIALFKTRQNDVFVCWDGKSLQERFLVIINKLIMGRKKLPYPVPFITIV